MKTIGVIDYGLGNNKSICNCLQYLGYRFIFTDNQKKLNECDILILPGVGSFPVGMKNLKEREIDTYLKNHSNDRIIIGICLGMQLFFTKGNEFEPTKGLNLVQGEVIKFEVSNRRIPNIGWRNTSYTKYNYIKNGPFYFVHSYHVIPDSEKVITSKSKFDEFEFVSSIQHKNIFGFQFHPEKSSQQGLFLLNQVINY